jgi:hypothetical protein
MASKEAPKFIDEGTSKKVLAYQREVELLKLSAFKNTVYPISSHLDHNGQGLQQESQAFHINK